MLRHVGTIAWFNNAKGYGFISYADGPDVFCHYSAIEATGYKSLKEAEPVEFCIVPGTTGKPQADKVVRLSTV